MVCPRTQGYGEEDLQQKSTLSKLVQHLPKRPLCVRVCTSPHRVPSGPGVDVNWALTFPLGCQASRACSSCYSLLSLPEEGLELLSIYRKGDDGGWGGPITELVVQLVTPSLEADGPCHVPGTGRRYALNT